ncbi:hypothetical protein VOLCADRAFT_117656 [Volvox carteri f. nagariensis]|uniref:Uncharacterized protein n=1 Tax=Volvox carteri f. nagariensis TaxID=3068 RepID=D8TWE6_VOLCA|nr:uncharacterized protein VOLCADRAFT_117656 [Volvox carteri f. nagariensis]EFJ48030.1 hypothetical protein VOLCADRAFT_117656 [Volvox carteri f. nagariensis]|eukprot:XP_002950715.1 hypothetical protein VOLCADRAFT_117656 [Volvox carteri f. nagariensis]
MADTLPQQIPTKSLLFGQNRSACMRGPGREVQPTDPTKGAIDCPRTDAKTDSSSDETSVDFGSRSGNTNRNSECRRGNSSASSSPPQGVPELPTVAEVLRTAKTFLQPTQLIERQFYADCYRACQPLPYFSYVPEIALRLSCLGHRVVVRRVTDTSHYWSRSMTNIFCYCVLPGTSIGYVLDPGFKEHFRAARMSDRGIWECLPPLFVGPPARLVQLVQVLCAELHASFEISHRQLPPWRTFSCTINRWMSPVFPGGGGGGGGGGAGVGTMTGVIPAAEAHAFLRACEELLANTPSAPRAVGRAGDAQLVVVIPCGLPRSVASSVAAPAAPEWRRKWRYPVARWFISPPPPPPPPPQPLGALLLIIILDR